MRLAAACSLQPAAEAVLGPVDWAQEHDPSHLHEERAKVTVPALGDAAKYGAIAGRDLSWHETKPGAEVAPAAEGRSVTDRGHHGAGDDWANAGHRHQPLASFVIIRQGLDLTGHRVDALVEMMQVRGKVLDHAHHSRRQGINTIGQDVRKRMAQ